MWRMIAVLTALVLTFSAGAQPHEPSGPIEAFIDQAMPASTAPGIAYAVVDGNAIQSGARGEMLLGRGRPVTDETPFQLGSISKSFTAMAVLQLVEAGEVALDAEIATYLSDFRGQHGSAITIRQLLSHTSGYSTLQGNQSHTDQTGEADELSARVRQLASIVPASDPGQRWWYSNANYLVLGRLVEVVSGRDFADYIETEILAPAGMGNSFVSDGAIHETIATGHPPWFMGRRPVADRRTSRVMAPAGGVIASATDLARYLAIMTNGEDDLISADNKALMLRPASPASPFYGLGWFLDPANETAYHTGVSPGVETIAALSTSDRRGVVVLINAGSGMGFGLTADLLYGSTALGLGNDYEGIGSQWSAQLFFVMMMALPLFFLAGIVGAWLLRSGLRAKSGLGGLFSLWFPLVTTSAMSWAFLFLVPNLFGVPLNTLSLYQPDMVILLITSSVAGLALAVFRLGLFYLYRPDRARG